MMRGLLLQLVAWIELLLCWVLSMLLPGLAVRRNRSTLQKLLRSALGCLHWARDYALKT
jgi:hypothetical protein